MHPDLADALAKEPAASSAWDGLTVAQRKRHLMDLALAKTPATLDKRIDGVLDALRQMA